jgi:hypothetical protein
MIADHEAETLLQAWGRHQLEQFEAEVGYPAVSASCAGYEAPDWQRPPPGPVRAGDVDLACWVMVVMASRHSRLHRDMRDHYRDGCRLGWQRLAEGRRVFAGIWATAEAVREPVNSL